ncbi:MAG: carboxylesterase family protein, partial [Chloroflexota bacterium]|nr:carboxylesterase family protein [Chloroflexota bacterium]
MQFSSGGFVSLRRTVACLVAAAALTVASAALFLSAASAAPRHHKLTAPLVVSTSYGKLRGVEVGKAQEFLRVPFARPPIYNLRFRPPVAPVRWSGIRDTTHLGPACLQFGAGTARPTESSSEDCLYLDVYRPGSVSKAHKLPVMVWIHGGGNVFASAIEYDAHKMAERTNTIIVVPNYRLGVMGFLSLPGLDAETLRLGSGNYGTLDQIQALK